MKIHIDRLVYRIVVAVLFRMSVGLRWRYGLYCKKVNDGDPIMSKEEWLARRIWVDP